MDSPAPGVIFHCDSDQDTPAAFTALAQDCQVTLSPGRTGQCWDNALAESFFASLEGELIDTRPWPARAQARRAIVEYIAGYNGTGCTAPWATAAPRNPETTTTKRSAK